MKKWLMIGTFVLATGMGATAIGLTQVRKNSAQWEASDVWSFLPDKKFVPYLTLGHREAFASAYWLRGLVYFGESIINDTDAKWMLHLLELIVTADPKFHSAYNFAGTAIRNAPNSDKDLEILAQGHEQFPDDWRLALFYALRLIEKHEDYLKASAVMQKYQYRTDVPSHITAIHIHFAAKGSPLPIALQLLLEAYYQQDDRGKMGVRNRIMELFPDAFSQEQLEFWLKHQHFSPLWNLAHQAQAPKKQLPAVTNESLQ
jgi:hypothetical protein